VFGNVSEVLSIGRLRL